MQASHRVSKKMQRIILRRIKNTVCQLIKCKLSTENELLQFKMTIDSEALRLTYNCAA